MCKILGPRFMWQNIRRSTNSQKYSIWFETCSSWFKTLQFA